MSRYVDTAIEQAMRAEPPEPPPLAVAASVPDVPHPVGFTELADDGRRVSDLPPGVDFGGIPEVAAFARALADEYARRTGRAGEGDRRLAALREHWARHMTSGQARRLTLAALANAWMRNRQEALLFETEPQRRPRGQARMWRNIWIEPPAPGELPAERNPPGVPLPGARSDSARVDPRTVAFLAELRRRFPYVRFSTYMGHGSAGFRGRGLSVDCRLTGRDAATGRDYGATTPRGFWDRDNVAEFFDHLDATARALGFHYFAIYNDFAVAKTVNSRALSGNVGFAGGIDAGGHLNYHGGGIKLHVHLDVIPPQLLARDDPRRRRGAVRPGQAVSHALTSAIEAYRSDSTGSTCATGAQAGAQALLRELEARFGGRGEIFKCRPVQGGSRLSLHGEGRAVDWYLDASDPAEAARAERIIDWLLGTDAEGNPHARARRMGVQEIIWNRRIWTARRHAEGWRPYAGTNPHTDHIHIGMNWPGARMGTSYWSRVPARAQQEAPAGAQLTDIWRQTRDKARVFDRLRRLGRTGPVADAGVLPALRGIFAAGSDDMWLAERLVRYGAEPLWPWTEIDARARRGWPVEAGNIEALLPDPHPRPGERRIPPVRAYFFPGREAGRRALVIGGVHGTEPQGAWAVERLRQGLADAARRGRRPRFSTILVPVLIELTHRTGSPPQRASRYRVGERNLPGPVEPNRTFPLPGMSYGAARARRAAGQTELVARPFDANGVTIPRSMPVPPSGPLSTTTIPPETRVLLALLERFCPQRIAAAHAHKLSGGPGDEPGIFVDPRGVDPATLAVTDPTARSQDIEFARAMLAEARRRTAAGLPTDPYSGNRPSPGREDVIYSSSLHAQGNSLGMYAPVAARDAAGAVVREAATTITLELPKWTDPAHLDAIVEVHRAVLEDVFLERSTP